MNKQIIFGGLEEVYVPRLNARLVAKIDTGAYSGALHVIEVHMETVDGENWLVYQPLDKSREIIRTQEFTRRKVRSTVGETEVRYLIPLDLVIGGQTYHTSISLSDRTSMTFPVILGRQLLSENNIIVDVTRNEHLRPTEGVY